MWENDFRQWQQSALLHKKADKVSDGTDELVDRKHQFYPPLVATCPEFKDIAPVNFMSTEKVTIREVMYKVGDVLYYKRELDNRYFGQILKIMVKNTRKYFILSKLDIVQFNSHLNSYEVKLCNQAICLHPIPESLWYPWPIIFNLTSSKWLVSLDGDIDVEQL